MVVLFMVLRDDTINQTMLVPMDLRKLIPKDHPCYFIKNVVDQIDCSEANREFADSPGEFAYPRELLLRLVLMSVFDGGLSSREIERRTQTDIGYMYLAGMQHPSYRTILRFKRDYSDLIDDAFKTTIKIATEEDLVKIHHVSLDGTKIKAKTSMNKLNEEQLIKRKIIISKFASSSFPISLLNFLRLYLVKRLESTLFAINDTNSSEG